MEIQTVKFQELWIDFISSFKGVLLTESRKQELSFAMVKVSLAQAVSTWLSEYTINGRWLYKLVADEPEKGKLVKEIIKEISLTEIEGKASNAKALMYGVPVAAGAVGYGAAKAFSFAALGTACAAIAPAIAAYPLVKSYIATKKESEKEKTISGYVMQLEKYKESIISALLA